MVSYCQNVLLKHEQTRWTKAVAPGDVPRASLAADNCPLYLSNLELWAYVDEILDHLIRVGIWCK